MTIDQELEYLKIEVQKLKADRARLTKALKESSRHGRRVERAYQDALLLAMWRCSGIIPSRRYARLHKITQHRYENACGLLRMARIVTGHRHWVETDLATAEKRLDQARQRAIESREAFFSRLNQHARGFGSA
jgi:hypothetical protein